ncbi:MAG: 4-hydroxythreonine-4-phosphate dehydrogenase PdxA [Planctomycetota bacterium]|nr:MAG: 4-hydroxythreonine-4-phosphate dehydrogenase PdxA [Planctomycetota bacterium]
MDGRRLIAVTAGDVAGIGPEIIVRSLADKRFPPSCQCVLIGHPRIFEHAAQLANVSLSLSPIAAEATDANEFRQQVSQLLNAGFQPYWNPCGDAVLSAPQCVVSSLAGDAAFQYLAAAIRIARANLVDAIATAPLNKEALHLANHHYPGHTEILAAHCGVSEFAMMLHLPEFAISSWRALVRPIGSNGTHAPSAGHGLSIAHVTLHTSVASVPSLLSIDNIAETVHLMADFLKRIRCERQAIAVCALNPHGGENGLFGDEEERLIQPAVQRSQQTFSNVVGPLPVDTLIRRAISGEFDGVVAMYHDQGHIPVKLIGFDLAVNVTLGLPIVRTSPTHGTAFDRAWNPNMMADPSGMIEAIRLAAVLSQSKVS